MKFTVVKVPPFFNSTGKPEMTVKRYWSRFKSYLLLTHKICIDPLITKQTDAIEKKTGGRQRGRQDLELALEAFKWVTGQETEKHLMKAYPKIKAHITI